MEFILIRHGQSESNARLTLALDSDLTDLGVRQAEATARYLLSESLLSAPARAEIFVSPFRRALQTCRPLARLAGIRAHVYADVCEFFADSNDAYRAFTGLAPDEICEQYPFVRLDGPVACPADWWPSALESRQAIYDRAARVRDHLVGRYGATDRQVVIYSHAEPLGRLIEALLFVDPAPDWPPWTENCGINRLRVRVSGEAAELIVANDTSHLEALGLISPVYPGTAPWATED